MTAIGTGIDTTGYQFERAGDYARAKARLQMADCPDCRGSGLSRNVVTDNGRKYDVVTPCGCTKLARRAELFNDARVPAVHAATTIDSYKVGSEAHSKARQVAVDFVRNWPSPRGFILSGPVGTGKSHLLAATLKYLTIELGVSAQYVELSHLYQQIRRGFQDGRSGGEIIQPLARVEVLAIDELGKGRGTAFELDTLDELISRRYNAGKVSLFATNYSLRQPEERSQRGLMDTAAIMNMSKESKLLADRVGDRIYSRLCEMCEFVEMPFTMQDTRRDLAAKAAPPAMRRRA